MTTHLTPRALPLAALLVTASLPGLRAAAADPPATESDVEAGRAKAFVAYAREAARGYTFTREDGRELTFREEPTLTWTNPAAGELYGVDFVWTHEGRPEMVASFFRWYAPYQSVNHEIHSLSLQPVRAVKDGEPVWIVDRPGVELAPMPLAPAPAETPAARLSQMKRLARDFSATHVSGDTTLELRMLPQPLFRYEGAAEADDGALFAFVEATDPDVILLLEARRTADGSQWHYGFARMGPQEVRASYRGQQVWQVPRLTWKESLDRSRGEPYTKFTTRPPQDAP